MQPSDLCLFQISNRLKKKLFILIETFPPLIATVHTTWSHFMKRLNSFSDADNCSYQMLRDSCAFCYQLKISFCSRKDTEIENIAAARLVIFEELNNLLVEIICSWSPLCAVKIFIHNSFLATIFFYKIPKRICEHDPNFGSFLTKVCSEDACWLHIAYGARNCMKLTY